MLESFEKLCDIPAELIIPLSPFSFLPWMGYLLTFDSARRWNKGDESSSRRIYSILAPRPRKCHIFINISNRSNRFPRGGGVRRCRFCFATFCFCVCFEIGRGWVRGGNERRHEAGIYSSLSEERSIKGREKLSEKIWKANAREGIGCNSDGRLCFGNLWTNNFYQLISNISDRINKNPNRYNNCVRKRMN